MIFRNSFAQSGAMITGYLFSFVLAPIMLARLGLEAFGVWAVTGALATYAALMDLGIARALERFVAFYRAHDDRRAIEQCFGLGLLAITLVGVIASVAAAAAAPIVNGVLGDVITDAEMRIVLLSSTAVMILSAYRSVMRAIPLGLQLQVPPSMALIAGNVINFIFSLVALAISDELVVYALANALATVVSLVPMGMALHRTFAPVRVRLPSRAVVREVLGFSLKSQVAWLGELINNQTDKIVIAIFIDVRAAGAYEVANRVVLALKAVSVMSMSALFAAATTRLVEEGRRVVPAFYRHYTRRALSISMPLLLFACAASPALMVAWLGDVPPQSVAIVVALTLVNCVNLATGVGSAIALGDGRAGVLANVATLVVIVNIAATLALTPFFGIWGVLGGTGLAIVAGAVVFLVWFHGQYDIPAAVFWRAAGGPVLLAALAALPIVFWQLLGLTSVDDRLPAFAVTAGFLAVYAAIYWPLASLTDMLPDRLQIRRLKRGSAAGRRSGALIAEPPREIT